MPATDGRRGRVDDEREFTDLLSVMEGFAFGRLREDIVAMG
jgi:hypothetical protein